MSDIPGSGCALVGVGFSLTWNRSWNLREALLAQKLVEAMGKHPICLRCKVLCVGAK